VTRTAPAPHHLTVDELEAGLDSIRESPADHGTVDLIVCRPQVEAREILAEGQLDLATGLVGDNWSVRGSSSRPDGSAHPDAQLTVINSRLARLVAGGSEARAALAGDQLHVDLDLSEASLPAGSRLAIGTAGAVIEITAKPHTGCAKFAARFGPVALRFVNTGAGRALNLRGRHAKVVVPGPVRRGDTVRRLA
jgi:hypothetical protein